MNKKKHIAFWIAFPIGFLLLLALTLFYFDLANGPLLVFGLAIANLLGLAAASIVLINKKKRWRLIPWGGFLLTLGLLLPFAKPDVLPKSAAYYDNPVPVSHTLRLENGLVQGIYNEDKSVEIYAGIPYAEAPVGELRWKEPVPVKNWEGVRDCSYFAPRAMQVDQSPIISSLIDMYAEKGWHPDYEMHPLQNMSEDCLYLNVWKPVDAQNAPILIYIHGGSLESGSSAYESYNGETMAKNGVIMVTIAYRLGVFGYLALPELAEESPNHSTGNYGLLDQIEAVKWVHQNALKLGGDPNRITIAGESAGSSSVSALCTTPLLRGKDIISYAIGESSSIVGQYPPHTFRSLDAAFKAGEKLKKEQGTSTLSALRNIPASELVQTDIKFTSMTLDGYALDKMPYQVYEAGENNEKALLNGYNVLEADAFVVPTYLFSPTNKSNIKSRLAEYFDADMAGKICEVYAKRIEEDAFSALNEIMSAYWFMYPHYQWSHLASKNGIPVYRYQFAKENGYYGTYHSGELPYCYGNLKKSGHAFAYDERDYLLESQMVAYWANFVKNGDPHVNGQVAWPAYVYGQERLLELNTICQMKDEKNLDLYALFDTYVPKQENESVSSSQGEQSSL